MSGLIEAKKILEQIKKDLNSGKIDYSVAKSQAIPYLVILNGKAKEIAKKFKKNYYPITFTNYMR